MSIAKTIGANWAKNTKSSAMGDHLKKGLWALLGGSLYWLFPTAIQGWAKIDMSGLKGVIVGVVGSSLTGILSDKPEIIAGGITAGGVHLTYNHLNGVITGVLNSPIFGYGKGSVTMTETGTENVAGASVSDGLPYGYSYNDKGEIIALDTPQQPTTTAPLTTGTTVGDWTDELGGNYKLQQSMNDFVGNIGGLAQTKQYDPSMSQM